MPQISVTAHVPCDPELAFAVSQTTGEVRLRWDPFVRKQQLLDGASIPGKGVRTFTRTRLGPSMISRYVAFRPPTSAGMTMERGPWFFETFGGGWRFTAHGDGGTTASWKYTFTTRPRLLAPLADRIGTWLLGREIRARIDAFARACEDPGVLAAVRER